MKTTPLFLRAKHWQIFVASIGVAFFAMIIMAIFMASIFASIDPQQLRNNQAPVHFETFSWIFYMFPVVVLLAASPQLLWMWSVVTKLGAYIRPAERMPRVGLFKLTLIVFALLIAYLPIHMIGFFEKAFELREAINPLSIVGFILGMFAIQLILMFCSLNNVYVVSKTIKMAEVQGRVRFSDFVGDFFFILFLFPVAIWFVQPRINAIVSAEPVNNEDDIQVTGLLD